MVKRYIQVSQIAMNPVSTHAMVLVTEKVKEGAEVIDQPIGEKALEFPSDLKQAEMISRIKQAAAEIVDIAEGARSLREKLNKELEKEELE